MNINVICVGKIKEDYFIKAAAEFEKRLSRFCNFNVISIADKPIPDNASLAECAAILKKEGDEILKKIGRSDTVIAMCIEGMQLASEELAKKIQGYTMQSSTIDFVIGGSLGLSDDVKKRADFKLSMSKMTFPHRIARLMLEEQIYRAFKINANETYHK